MDQSEDEQKKKPKRGRPSVWPEILGSGISSGYRLPAPVLAFIKDLRVKRLLAWMILDKEFNNKIMRQIPKEMPKNPK